MKWEQSEDSNKPNLRLISVAAARSAFLFMGGWLLFSLTLAIIHRWFGFGTNVHWETVPGAIFFAGLLWFCFIFGLIFFRQRAYSRAATMIEGTSLSSDVGSISYFGFVALEASSFSSYRTFLIFAAPDALYGWKAEETSIPPGPGYFLPYEELTRNAEFNRNLERIKGLASQCGGFVLSRSRIRSVEFIPGRTWWLGALPHPGRIVITSASGVTRKFTLLGNVDGVSIQQRILGTS